MALIPLEAAAHEAAALPPEVYGIATFVVLALMLTVVRGFGKSRPHS